MTMEHYCNDTDREKSKYFNKNVFQHHFVHHKYHMDWSVIAGTGLHLTM